MAEMYAKAQPSADYYQLLEDAKNGKIGKDERVYERYYLSHEEFKHILGKYKDAYNIKSHWEDDIEVLERYIKKAFDSIYEKGIKIERNKGNIRFFISFLLTRVKSNL